MPYYPPSSTPATISCVVGMTAAVTPALNANLVYDTVVQDTNSAYSTGTGLFTAPRTATYLIAVTAITGTTAALYVKVNGTAVATIITAVAGAVCSATIAWPVTAGQTVGIYTNTSGTFTATGGNGYLNLLTIVSEN